MGPYIFSGRTIYSLILMAHIEFSGTVYFQQKDRLFCSFMILRDRIFCAKWSYTCIFSAWGPYILRHGVYLLNKVAECFTLKCTICNVFIISQRFYAYQEFDFQTIQSTKNSPLLLDLYCRHRLTLHVFLGYHSEPIRPKQSSSKLSLKD